LPANINNVSFMNGSNPSGKETRRFQNMHKRLEAAIIDYNMINPGDHVIAGLSGGKDSSVLLKLLTRKKIQTTNDFKLSSVFVKTGFENDDITAEYLRGYSLGLGVPFHIVETDIYDRVISKSDEKPCYMCSRGRRLAIFDLADKIGGNVIAFGHHRNDFIETTLLNLFYSGSFQAMKPDNPFFGGKYRIIRPMVYIDEKMILAESEQSEVRTFPSECPFDSTSERMFIKDIIKTIEKRNPDAVKNIFRAMYSPNPDYLLKKPSKNV